jgi:HD-like signal output (HDOD) protein/FixJ family two-component response regulator
MHILVVDDEVASRSKMKTLMETFGECQTADNGMDAIALFEKAIETGRPFQLVTLDIEMPDLQGTEVLQLIRQIEKDNQVAPDQRAKIMMVTCRSEKQQVVDCIQTGCDAYIAKPFNIKAVQEKIKKFGLPLSDTCHAEPKHQPMSADNIFNDINRALRKGDLDLPAQPDISIRFRQLIAVHADVDQVAELLQKDMVIASKVIRTANSALYRGFGTVLNTGQAISRIGITNTEQLVTVLENQRLYATEQARFKAMLEKLWQHSLATAYAASILAGRKARHLPVDPFVAGLMHDIGALALIQIVAEMEKRKKFQMAISPDALSETVQNFHTVFGSKLLGKWNFAHEYLETVQNHKKLSAKAVNIQNCIVFIANLIAKIAGYAGVGRNEIDDLVATPAAQHLGLDAQKIEAAVQQTQIKMKEAEEVGTLS